MKEIFYELIKEAKDGYVVIDNQRWPIGFNTIIHDDEVEETNYNEKNMSTLVIKNKHVFFNLLEEYLITELNKNRRCIAFSDDDEKNHVKFLITYLMVNASTEDFINPIQYIKRNIDFLNDNTFDYLNEGVYLNLGELFKDSKLKIKNSEQSVMMETPKKLEISIIKENDSCNFEYKLPTISYGISTNNSGEKECYIYSLLNPKDKKELSEEEHIFSKKIWRLLYKINSGIEDGDESITDISKVSPSAVLSLVVFLSLLKEKDISTVKAVPYLPIRYLSRDIVAKENDGDLKEQLLDRNQKIQENVTDKFIRTFLRAAHHLDDCRVEMFPYEMDEFLHFKIGNNMKTDNVLLNEAIDSIHSKK